MEELSEKTNVKIPDNLKNIKNKKIIHSDVCSINEMGKYVVASSEK